MKAKKNIVNLKQYQVIDQPYLLKLDANESNNYLNNMSLSLQGVEYYPDHQAKSLKQALSKYIGIDSSLMTIGNGSSELLDLLFKAYIEPGDVVLSFDPTFSMYEIYANIYGANYIKVPSNDDFTLNMDLMISQLSLNPKMILLCTPNNPTGFQIPRKDILKLLNLTQALVVIDEAYIEFSDQNESMIKDIFIYNQIAVLRTFSKAYGLAGARLGYMVSSKDITSIMNKVRSPYHVNALSQKAGLMALSKRDLIFENIDEIKRVRETTGKMLIDLGFKVYKSQGNFLWVKSPIKALGIRLNEKGILIRDFSKDQSDFYRITIKQQNDMDILISSIKEIINETK
jgi:histidinol-phosphate aminotransferase